jgi:hypothetical protein
MFPLSILYLAYPFPSAYPPFDNNVRRYLTESFDGEEDALTRHLVFLESLFRLAVRKLDSYDQSTPAGIAMKWYEWMDNGSTPTHVGSYRQEFYDEVIKDARSVWLPSYYSYAPADGLPSLRIVHLSTSG